jgi:hypothetical protein
MGDRGWGMGAEGGDALTKDKRAREKLAEKLE